MRWTSARLPALIFRRQLGGRVQGSAGNHFVQRAADRGRHIGACRGESAGWPDRRRSDSGNAPIVSLPAGNTAKPVPPRASDEAAAEETVLAEEAHAHPRNLITRLVSRKPRGQDPRQIALRQQT